MVERKRSASGPSRMLARLRRPIRQYLLRQLPVVARRIPVRIVLQYRGAPHGSLGELDRLADTRLEDQLSEVLFQDLDRLLGVDGAGIEHRRQDSLDLDAR